MPAPRETRQAGRPIVFKGTAANDTNPAFSPDGRWIAYSSAETGTLEVYVSPFPGPGAAVPVSASGGSRPQWSATAHELLFWDGGKIMSVPYAASDTFVLGKPQLWACSHHESSAAFALLRRGRPTLSRI